MTQTGTQIIARHATLNGFSVAIIRERNAYRVVRIGDDGAMVTFDWSKTEKGAREIANRLWMRDMGRERMIGVGALAA